MRFFLSLFLFFLLNNCSAQNKTEHLFITKDYKQTDSAQAYFKKSIYYYGNDGQGAKVNIKYTILPKTYYESIWYNDFWENKRASDTLFNKNGSLKQVRNYDYGVLFETLQYNSLGSFQSKEKSFTNITKFEFYDGEISVSANSFMGIGPATSKTKKSSSNTSSIVAQLTYPKYAKQNGIEGTVYVSFTTDSTGEVTNVKIRKSPHPCLNQFAVDAVRQFPVKPNNLKKATQFTIPLEYSLD
jgi:TonB family protein